MVSCYSSPKWLRKERTPPLLTKDTIASGHIGTMGGREERASRNWLPTMAASSQIWSQASNNSSCHHSASMWLRKNGSLWWFAPTHSLLLEREREPSPLIVCLEKKFEPRDPRGSWNGWGQAMAKVGKLSAEPVTTVRLLRSCQKECHLMLGIYYSGEFSAVNQHSP